MNRGRDSKRVIDLLLSLRGAEFLRGNHDDVFDQVLHGESFCGQRGEYDRIAAFKWFMNFGLYQTFRSYGVSEEDLVRADERTTGALLDELAAALPVEHRDFVRGLRPIFEGDDFFVLHAKWEIERPTDAPAMSNQIAVEANLRQTIVWGRYTVEEIAAEKAWNRRGYFGHTPVTTYTDHGGALPIIGPKIVLVDTGAALPEGQRLTAFSHESGEFVQAHAMGHLVKGL